MTGADAKHVAERLLLGQSASTADAEALAALLARFDIETAAAGATVAAASGALLLFEGVLRAAHTGGHAVGALRAPGMARAVPLLVQSESAPPVYVADEPARLVRVDAPTFKSLLAEASPGAARFRWVVLSALSQQLAHMTDFMRLLVQGGPAAANAPLEVAEAILDGCEPPRA